MTLWQKHGELLPDRLGQYLDVGSEDALVRLFNGVDSLPEYGLPSQSVIVDPWFHLKQLNRPGTGRICWAARQQVIK